MTWTYWQLSWDSALPFFHHFSFSNISFRHIFKTAFGVVSFQLSWNLLLFFTCISSCLLLSHVPSSFLNLSLSVLRLSFQPDHSGMGGSGLVVWVSEAAAADDSSRGRCDLWLSVLHRLFLFLLQMGAGVPQLLDGLRQNLQRNRGVLILYCWFDYIVPLNTHSRL